VGGAAERLDPPGRPQSAQLARGTGPAGWCTIAGCQGEAQPWEAGPWPRRPAGSLASRWVRRAA